SDAIGQQAKESISRYVDTGNADVAIGESNSTGGVEGCAGEIYIASRRAKRDAATVSSHNTNIQLSSADVYVAGAGVSDGDAAAIAAGRATSCVDGAEYEIGRAA